MNYYQTDGQAAVLSGPHSERSTFIKKLTNCGNPELLDLRTYNLLPEVYPPIDLATQRYTSQRTVVGDTVVVGYEDISPAELAARDAALLAERLVRMEDAVRDYIEYKGAPGKDKGRIHFTAAAPIYDKAKGNKPKSKQITEWVTSVWNEYFVRYAALMSGTPWSDAFLDFSSLGECPVQVWEAMAE